MIFTADGRKIRPAAGFIHSWVKVHDDEGGSDAVSGQSIDPQEYSFMDKRADEREGER